ESSAYRQVRFDTLGQNRKIAAELDELSERSAKELSAVLARTAETDVRSTPASTSAGTSEGTQVVIDYAASRPEDWMPDDASFGTRPRRPGDLIVEGGRVKFAEVAAATYDRAWDALETPPDTEFDYGALGKRPRAGRTIRTPTFKIASGKVHYLVKGA